MRISEDRYSREQQRLDLALRFLKHEARTQTIRAWTGLTDDRIRKLYRGYVSHAPLYLARHRGKSPHQIAFFTRSQRLQMETQALASCLILLEVVPWQSSPGLDQTLPGLARGQSLCYAFEAYRAMIPSALISFEHAVFLAKALARGDLLRVGRCPECAGLVVTERFALREKKCVHCRDSASSRSRTQES